MSYKSDTRHSDSLEEMLSEPRGADHSLPVLHLPSRLMCTANLRLAEPSCLTDDKRRGDQIASPQLQGMKWQRQLGGGSDRVPGLNT